MKKLFIIGLCISLLIVGCNENQSRESTIKEMTGLSPMANCYLNYYEIELVDEIITDNCYVLKYIKIDDYDSYKINESLQFIGVDEYQWFKDNHKWVCESVQYEKGKIYCLKDMTKCLNIENINICEIIDLKI